MGNGTISIYSIRLSECCRTKKQASEILNRKRKLSLEMIRQIHDRPNIPTAADLFFCFFYQGKKDNGA